MFARSARRRCPTVRPPGDRGGGSSRCRRARGCRLRLDRSEPDYFLGAIVFNMAFAEGLFAASLFLVLLCHLAEPAVGRTLLRGIVG